MAESEIRKSSAWLSNILEGGLPQVIAGPAGKAISRLIGAGVEIPAAYLEGITQDIRDKSDARSRISQAIAARAATMAVDDPEVMARAVDNLMARSYRIQKNKDAIATVVINDLNNDPPSAESEGPSDDWLAKFERYAEDASSEDLRTMFGKLLAGEIRQPGAISKTTLHFTSMLDEQTAKLIERVLPACFEDGVAIIENLKPALTVSEIAYIEQSGFWSADKTFTLNFDSSGIYLKPINKNSLGIALRGKADSDIRFSAAILSKAGSDLVKIVGLPFDMQAFANVALTKDGVTNCYYGYIVYSDNKATIPAPTEVFSQP